MLYHGELLEFYLNSKTVDGLIMKIVFLSCIIICSVDNILGIDSLQNPVPVVDSYDDQEFKLSD